MLLLLEAREGNWDEIDLVVRQFQKATMALKYCRKPWSRRPFGMTLGGGCEMVLGRAERGGQRGDVHGPRRSGRRAHSRRWWLQGMVLRAIDGMPDVSDVDVFPFVRAAFETIGFAKFRQARRTRLRCASCAAATRS
jgi:3-hydroxyacyl-CoA dehydrogenase